MYNIVEIASDEPRYDPEHRKSCRHSDRRAITVLCPRITHISHAALLRPARQRRAQKFPRDVRQIVCLSLAYECLALSCVQCVSYKT